MIRSLVIPPRNKSPKDVVDDNLTDDVGVLRRNLSQESLEKCLEDGASMWIDVVSPEITEIRWLERWLHLSPPVVGRFIA